MPSSQCLKTYHGQNLCLFGRTSSLDASAPRKRPLRQPEDGHGTALMRWEPQFGERVYHPSPFLAWGAFCRVARPLCRLHEVCPEFAELATLSRILPTRTATSMLSFGIALKPTGRVLETMKLCERNRVFESGLFSHTSSDSRSHNLGVSHNLYPDSALTRQTSSTLQESTWFTDFENNHARKPLSKTLLSRAT